MASHNLARHARRTCSRTIAATTIVSLVGCFAWALLHLVGLAASLIVAVGGA